MKEDKMRKIHTKANLALNARKHNFCEVTCLSGIRESLPESSHDIFKQGVFQNGDTSAWRVTQLSKKIWLEQWNFCLGVDFLFTLYKSKEIK